MAMLSPLLFIVVVLIGSIGGSACIACCCPNNMCWRIFRNNPIFIPVVHSSDVPPLPVYHATAIILPPTADGDYYVSYAEITEKVGNILVTIPQRQFTMV